MGGDRAALATREAEAEGRPAAGADRAALTSILFVLCSGLPWELLPQEMGCGSGVTCWRRLRDWHQAGVWQAWHRVILDELGARNGIDWERAASDAINVTIAYPSVTSRAARSSPIWTSAALPYGELVLSRHPSDHLGPERYR